MKNIIISIVVLLVVAGGAWWIFNKINDGANTGDEFIGSYEMFTFTDPETGDSVMVSFSDNGNRALFTGLGYTEEVLEQAISASGARYVNTDESLVVWNKGDEITVFINDEIVFEGITGNDSGVNVAVYDDMYRYVWVWENTVLAGEDEDKEPATAGDFELTLSDDGMIGVNTDCNNAGGRYTLNNGALNISDDMVRTAMYCEGSMEDDFLSDLLGMTVLEVNANTLRLANGDESVVMNFSRGGEAPDVDVEVTSVVQ